LSPTTLREAIQRQDRRISATELMAEAPLLIAAKK
jgi:hypothetical protein